MSEPFDPTPLGPPATPPPPAGAAGNPWDRREQLGFFPALIETIKAFALSPGQAYGETRRSGDMFGPLIYAAILGVVVALVNAVWQMLFGASMLSFLESVMPAEQRDTFGSMLAAQGAGVVGALVGVILAPIFVVIGLFIWGGILHLCLMMVGGLNDSDAGFEGTLRTAAFAYTAQLAQIVPVVGGLIALVWGLVLTVIGLSTLHRTTQGKAIFAVLIPVVLCCVCVGILIFAMGGMIAAAIGNAQ